PDVISFHGYGYWDNGVTDHVIFDGDNTNSGGIPDILNSATRIHTVYPSKPMWITEMNVNAAWGQDPHGRPWHEFAAAWWAAVCRARAPARRQRRPERDHAHGGHAPADRREHLGAERAADGHAAAWLTGPVALPRLRARTADDHDRLGNDVLAL